MNNNQQFDEHIKEQFSNYAPAVHPRIWENIVAEKDKRKPVGFWISFFNKRNGLLLLALLLAAGSGTWLIIKNNSPVVAQMTAEKNQLAENNNQENKTKNTLQATNANTVNAEPAIKGANTNAGGTITVSGVSINSNSSLSVPGSKKVNTYSPSPEGNEEENSLGYTNNDNTKRRKTGLGILTNYQNKDVDEDEDDLPGQGTLLGRLTYNAEKIAAAKKTKVQLPPSFDPYIFLPGCPSLERDAAGNKKYLEIYAGPDIAFRSLSDTGSSVYLQKRKESTKFTSAYSAGIRYTKVFNNSMSIRGGINYSQINEKFTFVQGNLVQITYIIDANGDTTGSYITTGTRYKTNHNKYRSIDIPLMVGYEIGNGRLHANINVGPVVNIYSWQKGEILDRHSQPVNITTGKSSSPYQFKTNAGIGFMGAVSVYYRLNDKLHIMAEPYFRYNPSQVNEDKITLKQKNQTAGLRLGIRVDLR
ncbi:MAG TPA: hypothetical protein VK489_02800 [Ferruginibacter sp.]|nr:hypothetical protein [Ferruginibacter sp.]